MAELGLVLSCEHAGNRVPAAWQGLFRGQQETLASHRGYDLGIRPFAERLAGEFGQPLLACDLTRLLVDTNRSLGSRTLFSEFSRRLSSAQRQSLLADYYHPYRQAVRQAVNAALTVNQRVLHLSLHSFTPVLEGQRRQADVGLLYAPHHAGERALCRRWQAILGELAPGWRVRRNYPYRGTADSLATWLRRTLGHQGRYLGIELEINQQYPQAAGSDWRRLQADLLASLQRLLASPPGGGT